MRLFPNSWVRASLALAAATLLPAAAAAQEKLTDIKIDWASRSRPIANMSLAGTR